MGTDIHAATEVRQKDGSWKATLWPNRWYGDPAFAGLGEEKKKTPRLDIDRNYDLFAILGNVRNGFGFAGCDTGEGFNSLTDQRGLPADISDEARENGTTGDHSDSWCSLEELLDYDWAQVTKKRGWINGPQFEKWDRMKPWHEAPDEYCGGVEGAEIEHISMKEMREKIDWIRKRFTKKEPDTFLGGDAKIERLDWPAFTAAVKAELDKTYCLVEWETNYAEAAGRFYTRIIPQMIRLIPKGGTAEDVRLVFNFDS